MTDLAAALLGAGAGCTAIALHNIIRFRINFGRRIWPFRQPPADAGGPLRAVGPSAEHAARGPPGAGRRPAGSLARRRLNGATRLARRACRSNNLKRRSGRDRPTIIPQAELSNTEREPSNRETQADSKATSRTRITTMSNIDTRCPKCGISATIEDASATSSVAAQEWEITGVYNHKNCADCEAEDDDLCDRVATDATRPEQLPMMTTRTRSVARILAATAASRMRKTVPLIANTASPTAPPDQQAIFASHGPAHDAQTRRGEGDGNTRHHRRRRVMSITFRLTSAGGIVHSKPAPITTRQLAAFRDFVRANNVLTDDLDEEPEHPSYSFEASVCRFPWAIIARILGGSEEIVAVVEEAQFLGRRLSFYRDRQAHTITVRVSDAIDGFEDINLHNANGYAVLDALGLPADSCGEIDLTELRARLTDPNTKRRFINAGVARRFGFFEAAAAIEDTVSPRLVWS
ncbi:MAG: hypothetical protein ACSLE1_18530 [Sphingobium sp.]